MKILDELINLITYKEPNEYTFVLPQAKNIEKTEDSNNQISKEKQDYCYR